MATEHEGLDSPDPIREKKQFWGSRGFNRFFIVWDIVYTCIDSFNHHTGWSVLMASFTVVMLLSNKRQYGSYW